MNIILWAPLGAGTHYWGPGTSAYRLYRLNKNPDIKVTLVHGSDSQNDFPDVYNKQVKLGKLEGAGIINKIVFLINSFLWLLRNHKKYDVLHGLGPFWDTFFPALLFTKLGGKSFIKITGDKAGFSNNSRISRLTGISYFRRKKAQKITGYISLSKIITQSLIGVGINPEIIHEIPNGVDIERFHPVDQSTKLLLRKRLGLKNVYTYIFCGGLSHRKRVLETVEAAHELFNQGVNDFQLLVVGPDRSGVELHSKLERYIKKNDLKNHIILIENTENPELYYQASDAYILASRSEGMSNSLLEAMACGLPSIVTKISGSEDLIDDGTHGLFTTGKADDITKKMYYLYSSPKSDLMGINAKEKIISKYASTEILSNHILLFKEN